MKFLSDLPPLNTYVFIGVVSAVAYIAFTAIRTAWSGRCTRTTQVFRGVVATLLAGVLVVGGIVGRLVPAENVGLGRERIYAPGWHVYPPEDIVSLPVAGVFYIPYPNDRQFLEVSYLIGRAENLRVHRDDIRAFKNPTNQEELLFGASKKDAWKVNRDPFAAWLMWRLREYLPTSSQITSSPDSRMDAFLKTLSLYGVSTEAKLMIEHWRVRN
jgi:hypothetical protein